jgi:hypothetical protein
MEADSVPECGKLAAGLIADAAGGISVLRSAGVASHTGCQNPGEHSRKPPPSLCPFFAKAMKHQNSRRLDCGMESHFLYLGRSSAQRFWNRSEAGRRPPKANSQPQAAPKG